MIKKISYIAIVFTILMWIACWSYLQTPHAKQTFLHFVTQTIKDKTGYDVEIASISLPLSFHWKAHHVKIKQNDRTLMTASQVQFFIPYKELFHQAIAFLTSQEKTSMEFPSLKILFTDLQAFDQSFLQLVLNLQCDSVSSSSCEGKIHLNFSTDNLSDQMISGAFSYDEKRIDFQSIQAEYNHLKITGDIHYEVPDQNVHIFLVIDPDNIQDFHHNNCIFQGKISQLFTHPQAEVSLKGKQLKYRTWALEEFQVTTSIDLDSRYWPLQLEVKDPQQGELFANGTWNLKDHTWNLDLQHFEGKIHQQPYFSGLVTGELHLLGTLEQLTGGGFAATLSQVQLSDQIVETIKPFDATISGMIQPERLIGSAQITGITPHPISIHTELPLYVTLQSPYFHFQEGSPLATHIEAESSVNSLLQFLDIESSSLSGKASMQLDVTGFLQNPQVTGHIDLTDGTFESLTTGASFHHLNAHLEVDETHLALKSFEGRDIHGGIIKGLGSLELKKDLNFPFTLKLQLSHLSFLNLDFAKAAATGEAMVKGTSRGAKITGNLVTDFMHITIPEQIPALAHSVEVKYINGQAPIPQISTPQFPVELDLHIDAPHHTTISSKNLSSHWKGGVKIAGVSNGPLFYGDFKIVKGDYKFNGKTFDIKEGNIAFAGDPDKKSTLYVIASKDLGKLVADVILKGPVKKPSISFRSNPPLSQREILSWILFGRGTSDITPFQGTELSQSINELSTDCSPNVFSKLRDKFGLDRIDISKTEGNESNEVSLQVGKYISRGVFVSLNKSITSETNQVGIEVNLLQNIKAEAQVGDDASTQLQLKWKHDY